MPAKEKKNQLLVFTRESFSAAKKFESDIVRLYSRVSRDNDINKRPGIVAIGIGLQIMSLILSVIDYLLDDYEQRLSRFVNKILITVVGLILAIAAFLQAINIIAFVFKIAPIYFAVRVLLGIFNLGLNICNYLKFARLDNDTLKQAYKDAIKQGLIVFALDILLFSITSLLGTYNLGQIILFAYWGFGAIDNLIPLPSIVYKHYHAITDLLKDEQRPIFKYFRRAVKAISFIIYPFKIIGDFYIKPLETINKVESFLKKHIASAFFADLLKTAIVIVPLLLTFPFKVINTILFKPKDVLDIFQGLIIKNSTVIEPVDFLSYNARQNNDTIDKYISDKVTKGNTIRTSSKLCIASAISTVIWEFDKKQAIDGLYKLFILLYGEDRKDLTRAFWGRSRLYSLFLETYHRLLSEASIDHILKLLQNSFEYMDINCKKFESYRKGTYKSLVLHKVEFLLREAKDVQHTNIEIYVKKLEEINKYIDQELKDQRIVFSRHYQESKTEKLLSDVKLFCKYEVLRSKHVISAEKDIYSKYAP